MMKRETESMIKSGHAIEIECIIGTIRILVAGTLLEMIEIEVIEETLRTVTYHMIEAETGIEIIEEDTVGIEEVNKE